MSKIRFLDYALILILITAFLMPVLYITQYTHLFADDWCRTTTNFQKLIPNINFWYENLSGRYINAIFSYLPVYNLLVIRFILGISVIFLGIALYYFIHKLFLHYGLKSGQSQKIFLTILLYVTIIAQLPSLFEFFYWYAATTVYLYSVIFFLLFLGFLLNLEQERNVNLWLGSLIIVMLNGNNEMFLGITNFLLLVLSAKYYFDQKRSARGGSILFLVSLVSSLFVVLAPGSRSRQSFHPEGGDLFNSMISSILSAGIFSLKSLIEFPYLLFFLGLFFFVLSIKKFQSRICYNPFILGAISFIAITSTFFITYFAVGYMKTYEGRIGNLIHIIFLIFLFINLVNLAVWLSEKKFRRLNVYPLLSRGFFLIYIVILPGFNGNFKNIWEDLTGGDLERFSLAMQERKDRLKNVHTESLELAPIKGTRVMKFIDVKKDPADWRNECYRKMINEQYGLHLKKIKRSQ